MFRIGVYIMMAVLEVPINVFGQRNNFSFSSSRRPPNYACGIRKARSFVLVSATSQNPVQSVEENTSIVSQKFAFPIMVLVLVQS